MRKWGPLVAVCLGAFMLLLDTTIVVVALPALGESLGVSPSGLPWVMDGYALALAALLLAAGALADAWGGRAAYLAGTGVFACASLGCGLAGSASMLVALRIVQGVGGAAMLATSLALLGQAYQGRDRSVALGVWGACSGAAAALGPVLGGLLVDGPGWRWIFLVNVPVSAVAVVLTLRCLAQGTRRRGVRVDLAGTVTFTVFAGATTYAVVRAGEHGWGSAGVLGELGLAAAGLVAFVLAELRRARPMLDPRLFLRPAFGVVMCAALAYNAGAFGVLPYTSLWLQTLLGRDATGTGLALLPLAATSFVVAALGGRLLHGVSARWVLGGGLVLTGAGTAGQAVLGPGSGPGSLVVGLVVAGAGVGLAAPALGGAALASVAPEQAGTAGGAVNTFRQLGYALGVAVYGTVLTARVGDDLPGPAAHALVGGGAGALRETFPEHALRGAFAAGLDRAALVAGATALVAGLLVLLALRERGAQSPGGRGVEEPGGRGGRGTRPTGGRGRGPAEGGGAGGAGGGRAR
ncbi:MFS transporter [Streptomyces sp. P6-2-1]|uniref:MFS transporter n=1 Tax=Streptomyces sp. P6-2-1 TaxID=3422591 RepID=UPI003D35FC27